MKKNGINKLFEELEIDKNLKIEIKESNKTNIKYLDEDKYIVEFDTKPNLSYALNLINNVRIKSDLLIKPSVEKFGLMVDCSRNAVLNVSSIKKLVNEMAKMGFTYLQLYTEDNIVVKDEKYFGYFRGSYTKNEIKEIEKYCDLFGIELIPCIQTLAHMWAMFKWNEYSNIRDCSDIMLVDEERTYTLIDNFVKSLRDCFKSKHLNIGFDEADMVGKGKYFQLHGDVEKKSLVLRHLKRVNQICNKYGFEVECWSDMIVTLTNPSYRDLNNELNAKYYNELPKNVNLIYWDYYSENNKLYDKMLKEHKKIVKNPVMASAIWSHLGFTPHNEVSIKRLEIAYNSAKRNKINNFLITSWGDNGAECNVFALIPSLYYISEKRYSSKINYEKFEKMYNISFNDYMILDCNDAFDKKNKEVNPSKYLLYNDLLLGLLDFNMKSDVSLKYEGNYKKINEVLNKKPKYDFLFKTSLLLAEVLKDKADLGIKIRKAYKQKNICQLKEYILTIDKLIIEISNFYDAFKNQWCILNKRIGIEITDIRIGGLLLRLKDIRNILSDYCDLKTDVIEELEVTQIPFIKNKKGYITYNNYREEISNMWI